MGTLKAGGEPLPKDADVHCIACGAALYFLPDSYPLTFHCENDHFLTIGDLLDEFLPLGKAPEGTALEFWERNARLLHQLARQALEQHHTLTAADFQETAGRVDQWISQLRVLLPKTVPSPEPPPQGDAPGAPDLPVGRRNRTPDVL